MAKRIVYGIGGHLPGTPNAPGVPAHLEAANIVEWEDDGVVIPTPTLLTTSDDGYRVWLDEDSAEARLWVSRPGADHTDQAYTFVATSTDPTVLAVAIEDAVWSTRKSVPALTPVTRDQVKQAMGTLTPEQLAALKASVTRRGKLA